jgi:hypothetical protein
VADFKPNYSRPNNVSNYNPTIEQKVKSSGDGNARSNKPPTCWNCRLTGHRSFEYTIPKSENFTSKGGVNPRSCQQQPSKRNKYAKVGNVGIVGPGNSGETVSNVQVACVAMSKTFQGLPGFKPVVEIPEIRLPRFVDDDESWSDNEVVRVNECHVYAEPADRPGELLSSARPSSSKPPGVLLDDWLCDVDSSQQQPRCIVESDETVSGSCAYAVDLLQSAASRPGALAPLDVSSTSSDVQSAVRQAVNPGLQLSELQFMPVLINGIAESLQGLKDNGARIGVIQRRLVDGLNLQHVGRITIQGILGDSLETDLVMVEIKPAATAGYENIAPYIPVVFATCDIATGHDLILSETIVRQLHELQAYEVAAPVASHVSDTSVAAMTLRSRQLTDSRPGNTTNAMDRSTKDKNVDSQMIISNNQNSDNVISGSDANTLKVEQATDKTLSSCRAMADKGKGNFLVQNGFLYHLDQVLGEKVQQLCLPEDRRARVLKLAHDLCHEGYKRTKEKIRRSFFWSTLARDVKAYTNSCDECQKKAGLMRLLVKDRVPISVNPHDEIPFSHLYIDCIDPLFDKSEYNY